jgi:membrane-bound lytic murein transglycosylase B
MKLNLDSLHRYACGASRLLLLALVAALSTSCFAEHHPGAEAFARKAAREHQLDEQEVLRVLQQARFKQSIVDAISRPAEAKPWFEYRPIFLNQKRIDAGVSFWHDHEELLARAADRFQVDAQIIVAIIGVETLYGGNTGSYRVLDALATLAFHYPRSGRDRSEFFSNELMNFLVLGKEEGLPLQEVSGSYAGAMGLGQFMPSSYLEYAVDLDGDGRRDLWSSMDDVIGSVANYLHRHGWKIGAPVAYPATAAAGADLSLVAKEDFKLRHTAGQLARAGFTSIHEVPEDEPAVIIRLQEEHADAYWLGFNNFHVITRYNRSPLYAMAVFQLSEEIRRGMNR